MGDSCIEAERRIAALERELEVARMLCKPNEQLLEASGELEAELTRLREGLERIADELYPCSHNGAWAKKLARSLLNPPEQA